MRAEIIPMATAVLVALAPMTLQSQWPDRQNPLLPRTKDGQPDLNAAAPRLSDGRIDLSGIWRSSDTLGLQTDLDRAGEHLPMLPEATKIFRERSATEGRDHPRVRCLPRGTPNAMLWRNGPFKIVHTAALTLILFEEFVTYRQVFTDGRTFPEDPQPAWWGYSIGRWETDTFIIETTGLRDLSWLDFRGHPASDAMRITERYRRPNLGKLELDVTFNDPRFYARSWSVRTAFDLMPDTELIEHVCENEFSYERWQTK